MHSGACAHRDAYGLVLKKRGGGHGAPKKRGEPASGKPHPSRYAARAAQPRRDAKKASSGSKQREEKKKKKKSATGARSGGLAVPLPPPECWRGALSGGGWR